MGSAALELAYVASGRLDAYMERSINLWDVAAGALLVENAGGEFYAVPAPRAKCACVPTTAGSAKNSGWTACSNNSPAKSHLPAVPGWGTLSQRWRPSQKFLQGQLSLYSGQLGGSFFQRTVVLVCQHNAEGAFGLVLNRSLGKTVGEMIVADLPEVLKESPLYLGGPVQPAALSFLHTDSFMPEADVMPNLALGHSLDDLLEIGENVSPTKKGPAVCRVCRLEPRPVGNRNETQGMADLSLRPSSWCLKPRRTSCGKKSSSSRAAGKTSSWRKCRRICR